MFQLLFERSVDAMSLFDPRSGRFLESNAAAVRLLGAPDAMWLANASPAELSPERQPDGRLSLEKSEEVVRLALARGSHRFEWAARRHDGSNLSLDVVLTVMNSGDRPLLLTVSRDISDWKRTEGALRESEQKFRALFESLEQRVADRTAELVGANRHLQAEVDERLRRERVQQATYQISEAAHAAGDLSTFYARVHAIVRGLMPAENFYIALLDPATQLILFPYYRDEFSPIPPDPRPVGTGLTGVVLRTGRPLLADREMTTQSRREGEAVILEGVGVSYVESGRPAAIWLGVPLLSQGRAFGVMAVQDYRRETTYGAGDQQILTFVAEQTALAIERKRSEQALRDSEAQHRALFEASNQGVMLHDEKTFFAVNPAAVRMLGFQSADQLIGRHPAELAPPTQPDGQPSEVAASRHIQRCLQDGTARFEWVTRRSGGGEIFLDVLLTKIGLAGRRIIQAVVSDITERKRAEAELLRALAREQELGQLRANFVSMVSHEFRTPLGVIQSSAEILEDYLDRLDAAERREQLQSITQNTRRMAALMEEVLLIGRLDAGKMAFQPAPIDLAALVRRLVEEVLSATERRCPILLTIDQTRGEARADERLLRHILTNLLTNAVKYSEPGCPVTLSLAREDADAVCTVRDRGIGIPEPDLEWIFHAFHRGRNVGDRPGTGLGLVIVKRCVDLHGGRIKLASEIGEGTTVTVWLPLFT